MTGRGATGTVGSRVIATTAGTGVTTGGATETGTAGSRVVATTGATGIGTTAETATATIGATASEAGDHASGSGSTCCRADTAICV